MEKQTRKIRTSQGSEKPAWRNVMVAAINEAIVLQLMSIELGDNHRDTSGSGVGFHFKICGHAAYGHIRDIGWDELAVKVTVWPTPEVEKWGRVSMISKNAATLAGDLYALGWMERRDGAWLQTPRSHVIFGMKERLDTAARFELQEPLGFAVSGPFKN
jgi:hypothetical protein